MSTMNRLANSENRYQGDSKKVLCVCSAGLLRSPTLARLLATEKGFNTRSCGSNSDYALINLDEVLIHWADEIVFVNPQNYDSAKQRFDMAAKTVKILDVPDNFGYNDPKLVSILREAYNDAN